MGEPESTNFSVGKMILQIGKKLVNYGNILW